MKAAATADLRFVGKRRGQPSTAQEAINRLLVRLAADGKRVLTNPTGSNLTRGINSMLIHQATAAGKLLKVQRLSITKPQAIIICF